MVLISQKCYQCEHEDGHQKCDFHLHVECVPIASFWLTFISCDFTFQQDPRGRHDMVCDACGNDVKGWFFQSSIPGESRYLHPCCAKLDRNRTVRNGSIELDLKEETSSELGLCFRCRKYCYHVSCMKDNVEKGEKDEASNQQPSYETGTTSGVLTSLDLLEFAVDLVIFLISVIFGIPFPSVSKWIRKIW
ncbi:hypothetical protein AAG906_024440 [Vitis piasezkii]